MLSLSADFFQNKLFQKNSFRSTIRVSNGLGADRAIFLSAMIWMQTVYKAYQQTTKVAASKTHLNMGGTILAM